MITTANMRILEENSIFLGVSLLKLMENAGKGSFDVMNKRFRLKNKKILVVCHHGNNGGDGFVLIRHLDKIANVNVYFIGDRKKLKEEARINFNKLRKNIFVSNPDFNKYDIIVDAIFGTGFRGNLPSNIDYVVDNINKNKAIKVSLDVPTGVDSDTGDYVKKVNADLIICFHDIKMGLKSLRKKVKVVNIGIPKEAGKFLTKREIKLIKRNRFSHKGQNGRVLIIGGSLDLIGAVVLAGLACYRSGVDLVKVACPEKSALALNSYFPDLITKKLNGDNFSIKHFDEIKRMSRDVDVILVGNGMGDVKGLTEKILSLDILKVVDADAIKHVDLRKIKKAVITPHMGELKELLTKNRLELHELRKNVNNNVVLVKGVVDKIVSKDRVVFNKTGNDAMTVGGTGDILAGITAGVLAQSKDLFNSACLSAYVNGLIGDALFKEKGYGLIASDFIEQIPKFMKDFYAR